MPVLGRSRSLDHPRFLATAAARNDPSRRRGERPKALRGKRATDLLFLSASFFFSFIVNLYRYRSVQERIMLHERIIHKFILLHLNCRIQRKMV